MDRRKCYSDFFSQKSWQGMIRLMLLLFCSDRLLLSSSFSTTPTISKKASKTDNFITSIPSSMLNLANTREEIQENEIEQQERMNNRATDRFNSDISRLISSPSSSDHPSLPTIADEANEMLNHMVDLGFEPNLKTFRLVMSACESVFVTQIDKLKDSNVKKRKYSEKEKYALLEDEKITEYQKNIVRLYEKMKYYAETTTIYEDTIMMNHILFALSRNGKHISKIEDIIKNMNHIHHRTNESSHEQKEENDQKDMTMKSYEYIIQAYSFYLQQTQNDHQYDHENIQNKINGIFSRMEARVLEDIENAPDDCESTKLTLIPLLKAYTTVTSNIPLRSQYILKRLDDHILNGVDKTIIYSSEEIRQLILDVYINVILGVTRRSRTNATNDRRDDGIVSKNVIESIHLLVERIDDMNKWANEQNDKALLKLKSKNNHHQLTPVFNSVLSAWVRSCKTHSNRIDAKAISKIQQVLEKIELVLEIMKANEAQGCDIVTIHPDIHTYSSILNILCLMSSLSSHNTNMENMIEHQDITYYLDEIKARNLRFNPFTYSTAIEAYVYGNAPLDIPLSLLKEMQNTHSDTTVLTKPSIKHYSTIMNAFAKNSHPEQAQKLLLETIKLYKETSNDESLQPDLVFYSICIEAWAKSQDPNRSQNALSILENLVIREKEESLRVLIKRRKVDLTRIYTMVILALSNHPVEGNAKKAYDLLFSMESKPNIYTYNYAINACANAPEHDKDKRQEIFQMAVKLFKKIHSDFDGDSKSKVKEKNQPNSFTYAFFIKACTKLLDSYDPNRDKFIIQAFQICRQKNRMSDEVMYRFQRAEVASSEKLISQMDENIWKV